MGKYLRRWGFTPQKPIQRAYEQSPAAVQQWLDEDYPAIAGRAKAEGAEIHWGDETALVNTDTRGRSYAPRGQTPVAKVVGSTRQKLSMISTVNNQGKTRWMIIDGNFNHARLIEFFESLIDDTDQKVFLVLDNLGVHHCKPVKAWLAEHEDEIEVFYLPSYSPELNPDERLNADLKQAMGRRVPARSRPKLWKAAKQHMTQLEAEPHRVRAYFPRPARQVCGMILIMGRSNRPVQADAEQPASNRCQHSPDVGRWRGLIALCLLRWRCRCLSSKLGPASLKVFMHGSACLTGC